MMHMQDILSKLTALSEAAEVEVTHKGGTKEVTKTGVSHKGKYGNEYQGDDDNFKPEPTGEKRGRGRPPKGADKDGNVMKPDFSAFGATKKDVKLKPWDKKATVKHSLKEEFDQDKKGWSNLPNAKYIDAVLASVKANPDKWVTALKNAGGWTEARNAAYDAAQDAARDAGRDAAWDAAWDELWRVPQFRAHHSAGGTIMALIAYDDCAHLLNTNPEHVQMMAEIGNEAALLLYPAVLAMSNTSNKPVTEEGNYTATPMPGATAIKDSSGKQVAMAKTPQAAQAITNGDIEIGDEEVAEEAKWRQGYSASGHPAGYKHKSGEVGPLGGTYALEPGYDGDQKKVPVQKYRDRTDPLSNRTSLKLSTKGAPLTAKNAQRNLKGAIKQTAGQHGPVGVLPESVEPMNESVANSLDVIMHTYKHEIKNFQETGELDTALYDALYDHYSATGEMPYGVAKARTGDPMEWVAARFDADMDNMVQEEVRPENIPAVQRKQAGRDFPVTTDQVYRNNSRSDLSNMRKAAQQLPGTKLFGEDDVQFESWDKQLNSLLNEGMNVVANSGLGDGPDSVTVSATEDDAQSLLDLVKSAGLGMFSSEAKPEGEESEQDIEVVGDHDDMLSMLKRMAGTDKEAAPVDETRCEDGAICNTCNGSGEGQSEGSTCPSCKGTGEECGDDDDERDEYNPDDKLDEAFANDADGSFIADADYMTKQITGGLNGQKKSQSIGNKHTVIPDIESLADLKALSGLK